MNVVTVKKGDLAPIVQVVLVDAKGKPVNLTGIQSVTFRMTPVVKGLRADLSAAGEVVGDPLEGVVKYEWQAGDTDVVGMYEADFHVVFGDLTPESFPTSGFISVEVAPIPVA